MKDFKTAFDNAIVKDKAVGGAESSIKLHGDLTIGGSEVTIGVEVAGPESLFECLNDLD
jgi:hypothetical protein